MAEPRAIEACLVVVAPRLARGLEGAELQLPHLGLVAPSERTDAAWRAAESSRPGIRERASAGENPGQGSGEVAVIPVHGELMAREVRAAAESGSFIGYDAVVGMVRAAVSDPRVRGVVLDFDSPGGECANAFEAAAEIRELAKQKPIVAVANPHAFSAAYLLASACTKILVPESGAVGSIGVYTAHLDQSGFDAQKGVRITFVSAGEGKVDGHQHAPLTDTARAEMQARVDQYYDMFVRAVAAGRGLSPEQVKEIGARPKLGAEAVELGLADGIGGLEAAVELARRPAPFAPSSVAARSTRPLPAGLSNRRRTA